MNDCFEHIVEVFGTQRSVAEAAGVLKSTVSQWRHRGVPLEVKLRLLLVAEDENLPLDARRLDLPVSDKTLEHWPNHHAAA